MSGSWPQGGPPDPPSKIPRRFNGRHAGLKCWSRHVKKMKKEMFFREVNLFPDFSRPHSISQPVRPCPFLPFFPSSVEFSFVYISCVVRVFSCSRFLFVFFCCCLTSHLSPNYYFGFVDFISDFLFLFCNPIKPRPSSQPTWKWRSSRTGKKAP